MHTIKKVSKGRRKNFICAGFSSLRFSDDHETVTYQHHLVHLRKAEYELHLVPTVCSTLESVPQ